MPTGYNARLCEKEDCTFAEFLWDCAHATRYDSSVGTRMEPRKVTPYYAESLAEARAELARLRDLRVEDALKPSLDEHAKHCRQVVENNFKARALRSRLEAMRVNVEHWTPPTAEHEDFKQLMLAQVDEGLRHECYELGIPELVTPGTWLLRAIDATAREVAFREKFLREETARVAAGNAWLAALEASVPQPLQQAKVTSPGAPKSNILEKRLTRAIEALRDVVYVASEPDARVLVLEALDKLEAALKRARQN